MRELKDHRIGACPFRSKELISEIREADPEHRNPRYLSEKYFLYVPMQGMNNIYKAQIYSIGSTMEPLTNL